MEIQVYVVRHVELTSGLCANNLGACAITNYILVAQPPFLWATFMLFCHLPVLRVPLLFALSMIFAWGARLFEPYTYAT